MIGSVICTVTSTADIMFFFDHYGLYSVTSDEVTGIHARELGLSELIWVFNILFTNAVYYRKRRTKIDLIEMHGMATAAVWANVVAWKCCGTD